MIGLQTYTWRGKTYKTIAGLHNAMRKLWPGTGMSFCEKRCYLRDDAHEYAFNRKFDTRGNSIIGKDPVVRNR